MLGRFFSRPRRRTRPASLASSPEVLEDRTLLSAVSPTVDMSGISVDESSFSDTQIIVKWKSEATGDSLDLQSLANSILEGSTSEALSPLTPMIQKIMLPTGVDPTVALQMFQDSGLVEYAELDYRVSIMVTPDDPLYDGMWDLENSGQTGGTVDADIDVATAWETTTGSGSTVVAVIDTGIDYLHPDLAANMWVNEDEIAGDGIDNDGNGYIDDVHGYDFVGDTGDPMDDNGHGTHVAGTIGAVGDNGIGITGINWNVQLMALRILGADGSGSQSDAIEAILYAVDNGAQIINASWGGDPFSQILLDALETARDNDVIFVAAAGNGNFIGIGQNNDQIPFYPANYDVDNVVSVAATDHDDNLAFFSNYGATTVDLAAPGVDILSTLPGGGYGLSSGTSMAAPHVTGVIALIRDQNPDWTYEQIIDQLLATVDPLPSLQGVTVTGGRLNAGNAIPPERPEIRVSFNGTDLTDGSSIVDIGSTLRDAPLDATFHVTNVGTEDILLDSLITLPAGFTLVSGFADTTLSFGESTSFTIRLVSPTLGTFGGAVSFGNNDEDEGPFDFTITATVSDVAIIDDGDAGFSTTGVNWNSGTSSGGFEGDILFNDAGTGTATAEWTFAVAPGAYRIAITWKEGANRAIDAPLTVLDGSNVLTSLTLDQQLAPDDFSSEGGTWELVGDFIVTGPTLTVRLTDDAGGFVIADAVRVERIEPAPEINVEIDGTDISDGSGSVNFGTVILGDAVTKTVTVTNVGLTELSLDSVISVPDGFSITEEFGVTSLAPGESTTFVLQLDADFVGTFSGDVSFGNNDDDENPFNFNVTGSVADVAIIDDGDPGFSTTGANWGTGTTGGFNGDQRFNAAGTGSETAEWTFNVAPGTYEVSATWLAGTNRATNAAFMILDGADLVATITLNQQLSPDDFTADGATWERLGEFNITGDTLTIRLSDTADGFVIADAVRITPVSATPEIQVSVDGNDVSDGTGIVNFGGTLVGTSLIRTFTVTNIGTDELVLTDPISLPDGFSLVESFAATNLAPQQSTTFLVQLDATASGVYGGELSFGTNDVNENPFNFTISGTVADSVIIDDGDSGFSTNGANWGLGTNGGYNGDQLFNAAGTGTETAEWTFNVAPGTYQIAATWLAGLNRATNSPFTIMDGETVLAVVTLNQELSPDDFSADGAAWEVLGEYEITSGTLTVQLNDNANEFVAADAIRVAPIVAAPEIEVTVDGNALADGGTLDFGNALVGGPVSRTVTITNAGGADLTLQEPIILPDGYSLLQSFGSTILAPGESTTFVIQLDAAETGLYSGEVSFGTDDSNESPYNFTISATVAESVIIDDGDPGFATTGANWGLGTNGGYNGDQLFNAAGTGTETATWTFSVAPGTYQISTTWLAGLNRATNSPFTIMDGETVLAVVTLNQELTPDDFSADGANWEILGDFTITSGTLTVQLSDAANEFVIADAVRIAAAAEEPEIEVTVDGNPVADGGGFVDFGSALVGGAVSRTITVTNTGSADLTLNEPIVLPAGFSLAESFGSTTLAAGESTTFVIQLDATAAGAYSGEVSFGTDDSDENPFNFTISGSVADSVIIDDGDPGFTTTGANWGTGTNGGFNGDQLFNAAGSGSETAEWTFSVAPGTYQVATTWLAAANRATNAPFTIMDGETVLAVVTLNQELTPNDFTADGAAWEILGEFTITSGTLTVRVSDAANEFVIADAVRIAAATGSQGGTGDGGSSDDEQDGILPDRHQYGRNIVLPLIDEWRENGRGNGDKLGRILSDALKAGRQ